MATTSTAPLHRSWSIRRLSRADGGFAFAALGAAARWTSRTSAALQTDGRLVFAAARCGAAGALRRAAARTRAW